MTVEKAESAGWMQFVDGVRPGDLVEADATIVRATSSVVFVRGSLGVAGRPVAVADGVWKLLAAADPPPKRQRAADA